ncbi:MAG: aminopeptidase [Desulfomonilia bacterium]|jgi:aspartyl aminopeptidase|uniref:Putative M18 family aminopeptidase 1 n=1 Tax=anaerobic digester metagenome TaxID=1263854 RepID=A0A485LXV7_9ZZZZ|nr:aminopeptidase [Pseudomonadota bacterium]HON38135.1 aminopeptidase [Deltaproteobacteria bacterium]HRS56384.1 aminopeptidase [Desulfomonilia bacterium]HPD21498.1 aminopeptidase [Deltaproteobacteria bacterium]HPX18087.1 aminopeptidase [Deltaproteobacteria bacterium]
MPRKRATAKPDLVHKIKSGWEILKESLAEVESYNQEYLKFLTQVKTEREAVEYFRARAGEAGGLELVENRGKALAVCRRGAIPLKDGVRIVVAHIDCPRLDLKANPLYEDTDLAMLKTHYYGGIKKYQWLARPLALHGVVVKEDGSLLKVLIGEDPDDPCFTIEDLLPHLAANAQYSKKLPDAFQAEKLNIILGSRPDLTAKDSKVKAYILSLLHERYGIVEQDFVSADLEIVPAGPAREVGIDRSLIGGYGQDDRACSWAAFAAVRDAASKGFTSIALLMDKEEIGSEGNTGAKSMFIEEVLWELASRFGEEIVPSRVLFRSKAISGDANGAFDPDYPEVHEKMNAARLGYGVCVTKFTGARGKVGSSEAHAEYMAYIRSLLNRSQIPWQTGELGKVDEGGGGTVAKFLAEYGMDIVDMGPALLSMHSPFELSSKVDTYSTYLAYRAFMEDRG